MAKSRSKYTPEEAAELKKLLARLRQLKALHKILPSVKPSQEKRDTVMDVIIPERLEIEERIDQLRGKNKKSPPPKRH